MAASPELEKIGRRLAAAMAYRNVKPSRIAAKSGITRQTLWRYETGQTKPDLMTMAKVANTLGIRLEWLATGKEPMLEDTEAAV